MLRFLRLLSDRSAIRNRIAGARWHLAAVGISVMSMLAILLMLSRFPHPSGSDPAQWLTGAYSYLGRGPLVPGTSSYPPLYIALLAGLVLIFTDPVVALWVSLAILLFLLPFGAYCSYLLMTRDPLGATICCTGFAIGYPFFDMVAWGGYPNLLSIPIFLVALAFLVRSSIPGAVRRESMLLGLFAALVFLAHSLSALLFAIAAASYFILIQLRRADKAWVVSLTRYSLPVFAILYLPYFLYRYLAGGQTPAYFFPQPLYPLELFYYQVLPADLRWIYPLPMAAIVASAVILTLFTLYPLPWFLIRKKVPPGLRWLLHPTGYELGVRLYLIFVCTFLPPILFPLILASLGLYTDYGRMLYYLQPPMVAVIAALASRAIGSARSRKRPAPSRPTRSAGTDPAGEEHDPTDFSPDTRRPERRGTLRSHLPGPAISRWRLLAVLALVATLVATSGVHAFYYLYGASGYYSAFNDRPDADLAEWFRVSTGPSAVIAMSPEEENLRSVKWLEVLSARRTMGYSPPRYLFLDEERETNYELYEIFNHRYAAYGGSFEFGTQGTLQTNSYQLRLEVVDRLMAFPVLDIRDANSSVVYVNGTRVIADLPGRTVSPDATDPASPSLVLSAGNQTSGGIVRHATTSGRTASLTFRPRSDGSNVTAYEIILPRNLADHCSVEDVADGIRISVRTPYGCLPVEMRGIPSLDVDMTDRSLVIRLQAGPGGVAELRFSEDSVSPGLRTGPRIYDGLELLGTHRIGYLVLLVDNPLYQQFLHSQYGFPVVYQNSKYVVLGTGVGK